jgi:HEAT repeat protein
MKFFCTRCWQEIGETIACCPHCGANQEQLGQEPFVRKLIRALDHPEPETPVRAAYVLGELKVREAVPKLRRVIRQSKDPFLRAASIRALGKIGAATSSELTAALSNSELSVFERAALNEALVMISSKSVSSTQDEKTDE